MRQRTEPSKIAIEKATQAWRTSKTIDLKIIPELLLEFARIIEDYKEALIWCSGSNDFAEGGIAEEGWEKICKPLL